MSMNLVFALMLRLEFFCIFKKKLCFDTIDICDKKNTLTEYVHAILFTVDFIQTFSL